MKSISWAMGIRRPGFVLTSLWNPIDPETGKPLRTDSGITLQNHLCLLPDQLSVFIYYGTIFAFSMAVLFVRSVVTVVYRAESATAPVLPLSEHRPYPSQEPTSNTPSPGSSSSSVPSVPSFRGLASRAVNAPRSQPKPYHDDYPALDHSQDEAGLGRSKWKAEPFYRRRPQGPRQTAEFIGREFVQSIKYIAKFILPFYVFLVWRW